MLRQICYERKCHNVQYGVGIILAPIQNLTGEIVCFCVCVSNSRTSRANNEKGKIVTSENIVIYDIYGV